MRRWAAAASAALLVPALAGVWLWQGPQRQTRDVPVPPDSATAEQVVQAYVDAVNAHDRSTVHALLATDGSMTDRAVDAWRAMRNVRLLGTSIRTLADPAGPRYAEGVNVGVDFDLDCRWGHGDVSQPSGPTAWGYVLGRNTPDDPWRIVDQGAG